MFSNYLDLGKEEETENSFTEILKNDSTNVVVMNNNSLLAIYKNNSKESLKKLKKYPYFFDKIFKKLILLS